MKRLLYSLIVTSGLLTIACFPAEYIEVDSISISPPGGDAVNRLTAHIEGILVGEHTIEIVWMWHGSGDYENEEEIYSAQYLDLTPQGSFENDWWAESTISAGYGYVFLNYFWVEVYDENGTLLVRSNEVYCYND